MIKYSKCILDVGNNDNAGLTVRVMESLFLEKKLITNYKNIVKYDFYNKNNIFIIGVDNLEQIKDFINSPYEKIDSEKIKYYDFESWLKRFN